MNEFKKGDRVIVLPNIKYNITKPGSIGIVKNCKVETNCVLVDFIFIPGREEPDNSRYLL